MGEAGLNGFPFGLSTPMQYTSFLILSDKESAIVSLFIAVHTLRKKGEVKTVSVFTQLPCAMVP